MSPRLYDPTFVYSGRSKHTIDVEAANQDTVDSTYQYFGFLTVKGGWIIQRFHIYPTGPIKYEYAAGRNRSDYDLAWNGTTGRYQGSFTFTTIDQVALV